MSNVLLIWEMIPEETHLYLIPMEVYESNPDFEKYFVEAHNKFINNCDMNDGLRFLNTALSKTDPEAGFEKYLGIFIEYRWDEKTPINHKNIQGVYLSGFVL